MVQNVIASHGARLTIATGMSKDFAGGGLRLGCIYIRNKELARAMNSFTQFHWAGGPSQAIATLILENEDWLENFLEQSRTALAAANKTCRSRLEDAKIQCVRICSVPGGDTDNR